MLVFEKRLGETEVTGGSLSVQSREPRNSTHICRQICMEIEPGPNSCAPVPSLHPVRAVAGRKTNCRVRISSWISSWIFELDFRVGFSSWIFPVGFLSWFFEVVSVKCRLQTRGKMQTKVIMSLLKKLKHFRSANLRHN